MSKALNVNVSSSSEETTVKTDANKLFDHVYAKYSGSPEQQQQVQSASIAAPSPGAAGTTTFTSLGKLLQANAQWAQNHINQDPDFFTRLSKQQTPKLLWIGCADSRVPANEIINLQPGEVFVHRNIANVVQHSDVNLHSVLEYAVLVLKVEHIIVTGHYGCGGVAASLTQNAFGGTVDCWLRHIKDVSEAHATQMNCLKDPSQKIDLLCELNVVQSVINCAKSATVQKAWANGQTLNIHGWCYKLTDGRIRDLGVCVSGPEQIDDVFRIAKASAEPKH